MTRARVRLWIWSLLVLVYARPTQATYSIVATDSGTREVGGAVTSCVGTLDLSLVYGSAPGAGVVHAQAQLDNRLRGHDRAVQRLMQGVAPLEIIQEITNTGFDSAAASRQYGVVDVMGRAAGYTGTDAMTFRDDKQGSVGTFTYSVQGNILTSQKVLDQAAQAFEGRGCDLAARLMLALEAGALNGEGDKRCTSAGIPSDSAFIEVDRPGEPAGSYLRLSVSDTRPESPLPKLRAAFDAWRATHACAAVSGGAGGAAGGGRAAGAGTGSAAEGGGDSPAGATGGSAGLAAVGGAAGLAAVVGATGGAAGLAAVGGGARGALAAGNGSAGSVGAAGRGGLAAAGVGTTSRGQSGTSASGLVAGSSASAAHAASGCSVSGAGLSAGPAFGLVLAALLMVRSARKLRRERGELEPAAAVE